MARLPTALAALASGLLLWAASPAVGWGFLAWVALVPAAVAAVRGSRWALPLAYGVSLELMLVPALPFGLADDQWADEPLVPLLVGGSPVLAAALVAIPLLTLALGAIRFPLLGTRSIAVAATVWTALDVVRTKLDPAGLWGPLYLTQHDTAAAAAAALIGPWALTFLIVSVNLALARLSAAPAPAAAALALAGASVAAAQVVLPDDDVARLTVAAVQPGYDTAEFDRPLLAAHRQRRYAESARRLVADVAPLVRRAARAGAELVVLPEAFVWVEPARVEPLRALARSAEAALVVPFFLRGDARSGVVAVRPDATVSAAAPKQRPMWFVGEQAVNGPARPLAVGAGRVGPLLGVDVQDAGVARRLAAGGADVLASSTHDWRQLAPQQRAFARLASTAVGRPLVRADWRYGSVVYDRGRVVADAGGEKARRVVVAQVGAPVETPYVVLGDVAAWAALAGAAVAAAASIRRRTSGG